MSTWDRDTAPTWQPGAEADQLGWADETTGEVLVSTKPNTVNTNFLNQQERAKALAWVRAGLLLPSEAGMTGAIESVTMINGGNDFTTQPAVTFVSAGSGANATAIANLASSGRVVTATINTAGTGYKVGDELKLDNVGKGCLVVVDAVGGGGEITAVTLVNQGGGYLSNSSGLAGVGVLDAVVGINSTFDIIVGFAIESITVSVAGTEYEPHETDVVIAGGSGASANANIDDVGVGVFSTMESLAISRLP